MITAVGGKRVLMVLATVIVGGLLFKFCRDDRLPPQASDEAQGELLATVQSRITSHAEEYGWSASDIPLKKGVNLESIAFDNSPPPRSEISVPREDAAQRSEHSDAEQEKSPGQWKQREREESADQCQNTSQKRIGQLGPDMIDRLDATGDRRHQRGVG